MELSYCVVNTNGRDLLLGCLESIRRTHPEGVEREVLVLDNASDDGSAEAVAERFPDARLIVRDRRAGVGVNNSILLREARGRYCLLLNEDSELREGCVDALQRALEADPGAAVAGAQLLYPDLTPFPCAWRFQTLGTVLAQALFLHRFVIQSGGAVTRDVGWVQACTMLVRRDAAAAVSYLDPDFFVDSEEVDLQKRMHDAGWRVLHVPEAHAIHHEQLVSDRSEGAKRRIVQFHRSTDLYMRKHHPLPVALLARVLWAWSYVPRAIAATFMRGYEPRRYWLHARQALLPGRGEGMREAAEAYNRKRDAAGGARVEGRAHRPGPATSDPTEASLMAPDGA